MAIRALSVATVVIRGVRLQWSAGSTCGPCVHALPGRRSAGTTTSSSSRSAGTRTNRAVWYFPAVLPALVRHGLPAGECTWGRHGVDVARALIGGEIHPDILSELSLRRIWL